MEDRSAPEEVRREIARYDAEVVTLEEVLAKQVKALNRMVDALTSETIGSTVTEVKNRAVSRDAVTKAKELTNALAAATQAQTALDKTAELRAKRMTPEQRVRALQTAVLRMPYPERRVFLLALLEAHNALGGPEQPAGYARSFSEVL